MPFGVFVSHSVGPVELPIVHHLSAALTGAGVEPYLALYDRQPGALLSAKVQQNISRSEVLLVLVTSRGAESNYVHEEIGFALGRGLEVFPLVEKGVTVGQMLSGRQYIEFDPGSPSHAVDLMALQLKSVKQEREAETLRQTAERARQEAELWETIAVVAIIFVAAVALATLASRK